MPGKDPESVNPYRNIRHYLHDLAQPLATVTGLVDLLLLEMDEQDQKFLEVQMISDQLEKILTIVGEIRQIAQEASEGEKRPGPPRVPVV